MSKLDKVDKLIIRSVLETSIDQLAIVGGTLSSAKKSPETAFENEGFKVQHPNTTERSQVDLVVEEFRHLKVRVESPVSVLPTIIRF